MQKAPVSNLLQRILKVSILLIFLSFFVVLVIGTSVRSLNLEVKTLNAYLLTAQNIGTNFEKSLQLYTENTKDAIEFIHSLRPSTEIDYIKFISQLEDIGQGLSLNLDLESVNSSAIPSAVEKSNTIDYKVSFYGSKTDLTNFMRELERLSYFIVVDRVTFKSLDSLSTNEDVSLPNVSIIIKLYVK